MLGVTQLPSALAHRHSHVRRPRKALYVSDEDSLDIAQI